MSHHLLIYHEDAKAYHEILAKRLPQLTIRSATLPEEAWDFMEEAEIILSWQIPDDLLRRARCLRWFSSMAAGNENLVKNPNLPGSVILTKATVYGEMMAEYVFAYLLYFGRNLPEHFEDQKKKIWGRERPERLRGRVMGILGLGSVGQEIAKRGKQFGMKILGVKRTPEPMRYIDQVFGPRDPKKMIPLVDYLVVALPFTPETYHLLGEEELNLIKDGTILFNIGRGKTIDEMALTKVLKDGKIRAVLDVFEDEPLSPESELWNMENVIVTPHVSGINIPEEICEEFARNYKRWIKGKTPVGLVDRNKGY
jgi:phosphoglycerate dehydrogenase-like enzyme